MGNPGPVFGVENLAVTGPTRPIGERHVRFTLSDGSGELRTVAWGVREEVEEVVRAARGPLRAALKLERDVYLGREFLEGRLVALAAG